jgi:hypothetical protein
MLALTSPTSGCRSVGIVRSRTQTTEFVCFILVFQFLSTKLRFNGKRTPWPESASELYRPSDRRVSAKLVPTFADRGCHVVRVTDPYCPILGFLDRIFNEIQFVNIISCCVYVMRKVGLPDFDFFNRQYNNRI